MDDRPAWTEPQWKALITEIEGNHIYNAKSGSDPEIWAAEIKTERVQFLKLFWEQAVTRAKAQQLDPKSSEAWHLLVEASQVGAEISDCYLDIFSSYGERHLTDPNEVMQSGKIRLPGNLLPLDGKWRVPPDDPLEHGTITYLKSGWRTDLIDRTVLRLLLEREIGAYLSVTAEKDLFTNKSTLDTATSLAKESPARNLSFAAILLFFAAFGVGYLAARFEIGWLWYFVPVLLLLIPVWIVAYLIFGRAQFRKAKAAAQRTLNLVKLGCNTVKRYQGDGPIALQEFRRDVEELRAAGYVLPQALYGMIDHLAKEGKVII